MTPTPAESWHACGLYRVRVTRRTVKRRRRYFATVYPSERLADHSAHPWERATSERTGRTVMGDYATPTEAVAAAELLIAAVSGDDGERVCDWREVEAVRAARRRKAATP